MKFNKNEPYGTVYGHTEIAYEQNGQQFKPDYSLYDPKKQETLTLKTSERLSSARE